MSWYNNVCIKHPHNCLNGDSCHPSEECCYERDTEHGKKGNQGICVAKGSCNYKTGHPTNPTTNVCQTSVEGFRGMKKTSQPFTIIIISFVILVLAGGVIYVNCFT